MDLKFSEVKEWVQQYVTGWVDRNFFPRNRFRSIFLSGRRHDPIVTNDDGYVDVSFIEGTDHEEFVADTVAAMVTGNTETGITVTYDDADNTLDFVVSAEFIADTVGAMVTGNTESGIAVTYQDADNTLDFELDKPFILDAVGLMVSGNTETGITVTYQSSDNTIDFVVDSEFIADLVGAMLSGNTETGITVTYQDGDNTIDLVLSDEYIQDLIGAMIALSVGPVRGSYSDGAGTISFDLQLASVENQYLGSMAQNTIKGRISSSAGDPEDLTASQVRTLTGLIAGGAGDIWVEKAGDTMTGNLTVGNGAGGRAIFIDGGAGEARDLWYYTNGSPRWRLGTNNAAEGGSNAGSNFFIASYSDAGSLLETILTILRSTGNVGIDQATPQAQVHIGPGTDTPVTGTFQVYVAPNGVAGQVWRNCANDVEANISATTSVVIVGARTNNALHFYTNNTKRGEFTAAGVFVADNGINVGEDTLTVFDEGTWTPTVIGGASNPTVSYTTQAAQYTRINNRYLVQAQITIDTISGGSGGASISLPATAHATSHQVLTAMWYDSGALTLNPCVAFIFSGGASAFLFHADGTDVLVSELGASDAIYLSGNYTAA